MFDFYEFFAGGGMVRAGLGSDWRCLFANDFDHKKSRIYEQNWGKGVLKTLSVAELVPTDLPGRPSLAWASFPCQDLSLAGGGAGLRGERSGTFWPFWKLMKAVIDEGRAPELIVLENVCGTLTSHDGKDFKTICSAVQQAGYSLGAVVIDAELFVPQSRPRLFIVCVHNSVAIPGDCISNGPSSPWHTRVTRPYEDLTSRVRASWIWWHMPIPPKRAVTFVDIIEDNPKGVQLYSAEAVQRLMEQMSDLNLAKLRKAKKLNRRLVGGLYRRTRTDEEGQKVQRAEVRFDDLSGCLRTPAGGSSRQTILIVDGSSVKARLISTRETARLMGLPDTYMLPENYNEAYHLTGDGVVVPVVRHLAEHLFEPILRSTKASRTTAA
jgi:DNA (cytosine-5)-methyltransferase 1